MKWKIDVFSKHLCCISREYRKTVEKAINMYNRVKPDFWEMSNACRLTGVDGYLFLATKYREFYLLERR